MKSKFLICIGCLLLVLALLFAGFNMITDIRASKTAKSIVDKLMSDSPLSSSDKNSNPNHIPDTDDNDNKLSDGISGSEEGNVENIDMDDLPAYMLNPEMDMPVSEIQGLDFIGIIEFPSIGLVLPVTAELTNDSLAIAPGRYSGSLYQNDLILGGHNYVSHFGWLTTLPVGSKIIFTDLDGNVFNFISTVTEVLNYTDTDELKNGDWDLTLFTCTIGGQQRITVRCKRV